VEAALTKAVVDTEAYARDLREKIETLLRRLRQLPGPVMAMREGASDKTEALVTAFLPVVDEQSRLITDLFARQAHALSRFSIVLFGRTGTGKSTLIEALTGGDGATVSPGQSDCTKNVSSVRWNRAVLIDTPGINGWGNGETREELEKRARHAVETADLVLLCFDTQSQQATEFSKIMEWVGAYGKASISVLNVKNQGWRSPRKIWFKSQRQNISCQVAGHASNILGELGANSLAGVPVVAISSQRALAGLGRAPFRSPDGMLSKLRASGTSQLIMDSNIGILQELLIELLQHGATGLRLGALSGQLAGVLAQLEDKLHGLERQAQSEAEVLERKLLGLFQLFGYPRADSDLRKRMRALDDVDDPLRILEDLRKEPFQVPSNGTLQVDLKTVYSGQLAALRAQDLNKVEELVIDAFDQGRQISESELRKSFNREKEIKQIWRSVCQTAKQRIEKRVGVLNEGAAWDLEYIAQTLGEIDGAISDSMADFGDFLRKGGILAGILTGLVAIFSGGWIVGLAGSIVTGLMSWLGRRKQEEAEAEKLRKRRQAVAEKQGEVHRRYDDITVRMDEDLKRIIEKARFELSRAPLQTAVQLRSLSTHFSMMRNQIADVGANLPAQTCPQTLVQAAVRSVESRHKRSPWLGDSWIDDPTGLRVEDTPSEVRPEKDRKFWPEVARTFREWIDKRTRTPKPGAGSAWLATVRERLSAHDEAKPIIARLAEIKETSKPQIVLCGDYNSGKSSLIRRVFIEAGKPMPESLRIDAVPTTADAAEYDWNGLLLVDMPGFQSSNNSHTRNALHRYSEASLIMYLFQPNLVTGDTTYLDKILKGASGEFSVPKIRRTLCVINRIDELGSDPDIDPEGFKLRCTRKKSELSLALKSRGLNIHENDIECIASDPFGTSGTSRDISPAQFENFRAWDGIEELIGALLDRRRQLEAVGIDVSLLESGLARLGELQATLQARSDQQRSRIRILEESLASVDHIVEELSSIENNARTDLDLFLTRLAGELREAALAAQSEEEFSAIINEMSSPKDPRFLTHLERWFSGLQTNLEDWMSRANSTLDRQLRSQRLKNAFHPSVELPELPQGFNSGQKLAANLFGRAADTAKMLGNHDFVYAAGKMLGYKFRPWGAVNAARGVQSFGGYFQLLGVALDIWSYYRDVQRADDLDRKRRKFAADVTNWKDEVRDHLIANGEESPMAVIGALRKRIADEGDLLRAARQSYQAAVEEISQIQNKIRELAASARRALTEAA